MIITKQYKTKMREIIDNLTFQLRRQINIPFGSAVTMSKCKSKKCSTSARGGGYCLDCAQIKLGEYIGDVNSNLIVKYMQIKKMTSSGDKVSVQYRQS